MPLPLKETLNALIGRSYTRNGKPLTVQKITVDSERVVIYTTGGNHEKHPDQVPAFLKSLIPADAPLSSSLPAPTSLPVAASIASPSKLQKMQDALMDALEKVQHDEGYAPQAKEISRLVQTGINLAKLEMEALKLARV